MVMKPGDYKQEYFDELNRANLNHFKKWWDNLTEVMIISARDDQVCEWCKKANYSVVSIEKAVIPPVPVFLCSCQRVSGLPVVCPIYGFCCLVSIPK
jgi:hypothetical protein